jgi:hypothetical protein
MNEQDDRDWLEALAGRPTTGDSPGMVGGRALRAALQALQQEELAEPPAADGAREAALLERARRAGLLAAAPKTGRPAGLLALAAGLVLATLFGLNLLEFTRPPTETVRGVEAEAQRRVVADPEAAQRGLIDALRAAEVEAGGYRWLDRWGVDAEYTPPPAPALQQVLDAFELEASPDGVLRVEFMAGEE